MSVNKEIAIQDVMRQLQAKAEAWNVTLEETRETPTSLLGFGVRAGHRVVLKITRHEGDESHSGKVLEAFNGDGAVRVYEHETGAVLLERLEPGELLVNLEDDKATMILAGVMKKLAHHQAPVECPTVADWGRGFDRYLASGDRQLPIELVHEAHALYQELASTQGTTMLLHGDLQHYNVLFDNERGWIAIDPKGVIGEWEYEVGPLLRNPVEQPERFANPETIIRRLEILTTLLPLNYSRALRWSYAQSILSTIWGLEDGYPLESNNPSLTLARLLRALL